MFKEIALSNKKLTCLTFITLILFSSCKLLLSQVIRMDLQVAEMSLDINFNKLILINILILGLMFFLDFISIKFTEKFLSHSKFYLNSKLFQSSVSNKIYDEVNHIELISKFNNDIPIIVNQYISVIISITYFIFSCLIGITYISSINIYLSIYIILISLLVLTSTKYFSRKLSIIQKKLNISLKNINSMINNFIRNYTLFKVFNIMHVLNKDFEKTNLKHKDIYYKTNIMSRYNEVVNDLGGWVITCGLYLLGIFLIQKTILSFSDLVAAAQASTMITTPIFWLSNTISSLAKSKLIREDFNNYITNHPSNTDSYTISTINCIEFKNVSLNYGNTKILNNLNLKIQSSKKYAFIGESGCGKSTVLKLILKLINSYNGAILINNDDIKNINDTSIYNLISYIGQENFIINDTIKNNITMYSTYNEIKMNQILKLLSLDDLVQQKGLEYILDENSNKISGGEKQRINIARALYKDSKILIIDEGFSSLDMIQSKTIESFILSRYNTIISVMHKFDKETLKNYDFIINFDTL